MIQKLIATGLLASVAAAALAVQAPAPVVPPAPPAPPMAGKDMTRGEVQAMVREHFGRLDRNNDGAIAKDELDFGPMAMHGGPDGPGERRVVVMRHDEGGEHGEMAMHGPDDGPGHGDMVIEHHARPGGGDPGKAFDRLDTNKDGSISREEFAKGREIRIERRIARSGHEGADGAPMKRMQLRHKGGMAGARIIVMSDIDKDGRITLAEAEAMALKHFDQMDANKDGRVTAEERRAGRPMLFRMRHKEHAPKAS